MYSDSICVCNFIFIQSICPKIIKWILFQMVLNCTDLTWKELKMVQLVSIQICKWYKLWNKVKFSEFSEQVIINILLYIFIFALQIGIVFIIAKIIGRVRIILLCCWCNIDRIFFCLSHKLGYITSGIIFLNNSQKNEQNISLLFMGSMIKYISLRTNHIKHI